MTETTDAASRRPPLQRSATDRYLAGVCAGIARALGVDPTLVRVAAVILAALGGAGILAYGAAVLLMPEEGHAEPLLRGTGDDRRDALIGIVLLVLGLVAVFDGGPWHRPGPPAWLGWALLIAVLVVVARPGVRARWLHHAQEPAAAPSPPGGWTEPPTTPAPPAGAADAPTTPFRPAGAADAPTTPLRPAGAADAPTTPLRPAGAADAGSDAPTAPIPPAPAPRLTPAGDVAVIAGGVVLMAIAVTGALVATGTIHLRWDVLLAAGAILVGAALTAGAVFGGARLLIAPAILLLAVTGMVSAADLDLRGGIGDRLHRPVTAAEVPGEYRLAIGQLDVDLSQLAVPAGTQRVNVRLGVGEARVTVPRGVAVTVDGHANAGLVAAFERQANGTDVHLTAGSASRPAGPRLVIDARVGLGEVLVRRVGDPVAVRGNDSHPPAPFAVLGWGSLGGLADAFA